MNRKNILTFQRGPNNSIWEFDAYKVCVYKLYNVIQVMGHWYKKDSSATVTGVLNLRYSEDNMKKARNHNLTASEILS